MVLKRKLLVSYLSSHNPLPFLDQSTFGALAVPVRAGLLVAAETGNQTVVSTPSTLRDPSPPVVHFR